jgi:phosphate transport system substrate-binding protein
LNFLKKLALAIAAASVLALQTSFPASAAGTTYVPITGTGSTWSQNALDQWRKNVAANYGMTVNYSGTGSSAGRSDFIKGIVDFAVSEIPFQLHPLDGSAPEVVPRGYAYMPIVAGGTSFMYNLKINGQRVTNLRLSGDTITKIFTGKITNWNDKQIQADNPKLVMPNKPIVPVVRSDGSGTTAQFTLWMSKQYPSQWSAFCKTTGIGTGSACGLTSQFPNYPGFKYQSGSNGVAGYVSQDYGEGAITYVEYSYALKAGFPVAKVLNKAGYYVQPTADSVAVALLQAKINTDKSSDAYLTQILDGVYNNPDPRTYPISSYSYMIVPTGVGGVFTAKKGATLGAFAHYMLCEGQQQAADLGYSPLPMNLVQAGFDQIKRIPGIDVAADTSSSNCNNPTFKAGDSPSNNLLAQQAPQPQPCDKQGTDQCMTGASSSGSGSVSGSSSGSGSGTSGSDGSASSDSTGTQNGSGGGNGLPVNVEAYPYKVPTEGFGYQQVVMTVAGILLLLVVILPPVLMNYLRRRS